MRALLLVAVLGACAPEVPSVADRAHASDLLDQAALERQLLAVPGVTGAHALLHRAVTDPLTGARSPASASLLVSVAGDHASVEATARRLAPTATVVVIDAPAPAKHKPIAAILALVAILGAAGYVAWRTKPVRP